MDLLPLPASTDPVGFVLIRSGIRVLRASEQGGGDSGCASEWVNLP